VSSSAIRSAAGSHEGERHLAEPGRIDRLVLVDSAGYRLDSLSVPLGFRIAKIPVLNQLMKLCCRVAWSNRAFATCTGTRAGSRPNSLIAISTSPREAGNREALVRRFRQSQPGADAERVSGVKIPRRSSGADAIG
jgi:hypothetical protein